VPTPDQRPVEDLLRTLAPQVLGTLVRRHGNFARCEDAVADAVLDAYASWPGNPPRQPRGWLTTVATRRLVDGLRSDAARERREAAVAQEARLFAPAADEPEPGDDSLTLLFLCCHPALSQAAQLTLTLRALGGLTTAEIARALLLPESTVAQRISRAKAGIRAAGARFAAPSGPELLGRLAVVHQTLYLMFSEGFSATAGDDLMRSDLTTEAIRLTRQLHERLPSSAETAGLLALMLLHDSRRAARVDASGALVPLAEQDRTRWNGKQIAEGIELITATLTNNPAGPYQVQAAIAAVHAEAPSNDDTDWPQIAGLYAVLERLAPNPVVTLNRAVAVGMARGPQAGLALLDELTESLAGHHRLAAVRAYLLERAGQQQAAAEYRAAARLATNLAEQRHLTLRAVQLEQSTGTVARCRPR